MANPLLGNTAQQSANPLLQRTGAIAPFSTTPTSSHNRTAVSSNPLLGDSQPSGLFNRIATATGVKEKPAGEKGTSIWTPIDYLLNSAVFAGAGALKESFKKTKAIKKRKDAGEDVPIMDYIRAHALNPENWGGAVENLDPKNRRSAYDVTREALPDNPTAGAISFLADLSAPVPAPAKIAQITKLDKVAGRAARATKADQGFEAFKKVAAPVFQYRGGQPAEYAARAEQTIRDSHKGQILAQEVGDLLSKGLSQAEQMRIGQIMKGGLTTKKTDPKLVERATEARSVIDTLSKQLVDEAMIGAEKQLTPKGLSAELINTLTKTFKKPDPTLGVEEKGWRAPDELALELVKVFEKYQPAHVKGMADIVKTLPGGAKKTVRGFQDIGADVRGKVATVKGGEEVVKNAFNPEDAVVGIPKVERVPGTEPPTAFTQTPEGFAPVEGSVSVQKPVNAEGLPQRPEARPYVEPEYYQREAQTGGIKLNERTVKTIQENMGKYLPRLYKEYETNPEGFAKYLSSNKATIDRQRLMQRKDIPDEVRKTLGEIMTPAYPAAKGVAQVSDMIAKSKFLRWVNDNFAHIENIDTKMVQIPDAPSYGMLAGKFVPKEIAGDLIGKIQPRTKGGFEKAYDKALSWWKTGKVVMNPASVSRNQMTNMMGMTVLGDMPSYEVINPKRWTDAAMDIKNQTAFYKLLQKDTDLISDTIYSNELGRFLDDIVVENANQNPLVRIGKASVKAPGKAYTAVEQMSKIVLTKYWVEQGKSLQEASKIAEHALFNYRKVPKAIDWLRKTPFGYPFITYSYFAVPRYAEKVAKDPKKLAQLSRTAQNIEAEAKQQLGPASKSQLPEYMKGQYLRLPFQEKGQDLYLDLNYIVPWGIINTTTGEPQNPAFTLVADLYRNKSSFTDDEIYSETDSDDVKKQKVGKYVYQALMPTIAPGGWSADKIGNLGLFGPQRPDGFGRLREMPTVLLDVFLGLKATPIDYEVTEQIKAGKKKQLMQKAEDEVRKIQRDKKLFPEDKKKEIQRKAEDMKRISAGNE